MFSFQFSDILLHTQPDGSFKNEILLQRMKVGKFINMDYTIDIHVCISMYMYNTCIVLTGH